MPDDLPSGVRALSMQFSYLGIDITVVDAQLIEGSVPLWMDTEPPGDGPGFWYELRDVVDNVVWRQSAPHPIRFESEGPADDIGALTWAPDPAPAGSFSAQVPLLEGAVTLALVGSPPPGAAPGPVADLAIFDIRELQ